MDQHILGSHSTDEFLSDYWQQRPLLIRQAIRDFHTDLTPDILAGLSLEDGIRSRIVIEQTHAPYWECRFGPFTEDTFSQLPANNWTLLVQDVEKHLPEHASLLDYFDFLPRWRIDDLMVSYAVDGGSVGPHTDNYDVFLLQASGRRQWRIQSSGFDTNDLIDDIELKILKRFHAQTTWTLEPGDMLYLPPGVAHHGIAIGDCMTFSIGFRAPTQQELLQSLADKFVAGGHGLEHFTDPRESLSCRRGELNQASLEQFHTLIRSSIDDPSLLNCAIAGLLTEPTDSPSTTPVDDESLDVFKTLLSRSTAISFHPAVRALYIRQQDSVQYFINTRQYEASLPFSENIMQLIDNYRLPASSLPELLSDHQTINALYQVYLDGGLNIEL